jgi:hypothetical protein
MRADSLSAWSPGKAEKWQLAFIQLLEASCCAQDSRHTPWQFAIGITILFAAVLTANDLRWLDSKGYIEHSLETAKSGRQRLRQFRSPGLSLLGTRSCVVLTKAGVAFGQNCCRRRVAMANRVSRRKRSSDDRVNENPRWDAAGRTLWLEAKLVKRFGVPAANQELILAAFEEEGWPSGIDDPLPPVADIDPKHRLQGVIFRLNGCQKQRLIRFMGNGDGLGIRWERLPRAGAGRNGSEANRTRTMRVRHA